MESFGATIIDEISSSSVSFLTTFVDSYWSVLLTIGAVLFVGRWFLKLTGIGR